MSFTIKRTLTVQPIEAGEALSWHNKLQEQVGLDNQLLRVNSLMHWRAGDWLAHVAEAIPRPGSVIISANLALLKLFPTRASDSASCIAIGELAAVFT